ncbi:MAG: hypothetical protein WCP19_07270 [Chloroflexota bacterium]
MALSKVDGPVNFAGGCLPVVVDSTVIASSNWSISLSKTTGVLIGGILPVEEAVFFFITGVNITFGLTLTASPLSKKRMEIWKLNKFKGFPE